MIPDSLNPMIPTAVKNRNAAPDGVAIIAKFQMMDAIIKLDLDALRHILPICCPQFAGQPLTDADLLLIAHSTRRHIVWASIHERQGSVIWCEQNLPKPH